MRACATKIQDSMIEPESIATHEEFERHLFLLERCGQHERAKSARESGFLTWLREAIEKSLALFKGTMERHGGPVRRADIAETIRQLEVELEKIELTTA